MSLQWRLLGPIAACGAAMLAYVMWGWLPGDPPSRPVLAAVVGIGIAALLVIARLAIGSAIRRPPPGLGWGGDDFLSGLGERLDALERRLAEREAEAEQALRQCREAQSALQLAEVRYALAVRSASDGLWEWNLQNGAMYLSPRWKSMLGFGEDGIANSRESWRERIHPEDRAHAEAALEAHLRGDTPRYEHQHRLLHKDGRFRWVLSRGAAIRHASGKPYRVVGLDTDVTRIQRVEAILHQIVEGTSGAWGDMLFHSLVKHFAMALQVPRAFISECCDQPPTRVRTLAHWEQDGFADNFEYELAGSPCAGVMQGSTCFYPRELARLFPLEEGWESYLGVPIFGADGRVIGHLAFLDRREMPEDILVDAVFRIFAARAGAELERRHALEALHRLETRATLTPPGSVTCG